MDTREFLEALYGNLESGYMGVTTYPADGSPITRFFDKDQLSEMEDYILSQGSHTNTAIGINPRKQDLGAYKRGDASDVASVIGLKGDYDICGPAHAEKALPLSKQLLLEFIEELPVKPSILVFSGNGIHAYWLFKMPFIITDDASRKYIESLSKGFENFILKKARDEHGWKFDPVSDLARMMRAVGTTNFKTEDRPVCSVIHNGPERYEVSEFEGYQYSAEYSGAAGSDECDAFALMGTGDAEELIEKCDFLKYWRDDAANASEPLWYGGITIVSRTANGRQVTHEVSSAYPKYSHAETERKFNHALEQDKPLTCETIRERFGICTCKDCGVKSPIGLIHGGTTQEPVWEAPIPFDAFSLPEFPVDALPEPIREYAAALAEETQTPVDMACVSVLSVIAISAQGKYLIAGKPGWKEPLNMFFLCIMEPSERKSAVENAAARPMNNHEAQWNKENAGAIEASRSTKRMLEKRQRILEDEVCKGKTDASELGKISQQIAEYREQKPLRLYVDDVTPEKLASILAENDGRAAILSTEGGIFDMLSGIYTKNVNIDVLLKGYSGDPIRVDRVGRNSETIMNPALTILLMAQPSVLSGIMSNGTFRGRGLTARFMYSIPKSFVGQRRYRSTPVPEEVYQRYADCVENILRDEYLEKPELITLSAEADRMLEAFAIELEPKLKEEYSDISDWAGKLVGNTLRLAGLLCRASAYRDHGFLDVAEPLVVDAATMANAIRIARYFIEHARAAFSLMGADQKVKSCESVMEAIIKAGLAEFKLRDVMRLCRNFKTKEALQPVLDQLADYGYIAIKDAPAYTGKGRPPAPVYLVNPYVYANQ